MTPRVKVLYILGRGRSGSTVLDNILGDIDGFFSTGELRKIWFRVDQPTGRCGCNKLFAECEVWGQMGARSFGAPGSMPTREVLSLMRRVTRIRNVGKLLRSPIGGSSEWPELRRYLGVLLGLYGTLADITRSRVIIDSSKDTAEGAAIRLVPDIDAYYLHLVRDPRAVAYSWQRIKHMPDLEADIPNLSVRRSAIRWNVINLQAEAIRRRHDPNKFMRLRYEDMVAFPRPAIEAVARMVGEPAEGIPWIDECTVEGSVKHFVGGNPDRFRVGPITLKEDDEWLTKLSKPDRISTTAVTMPIMLRYGYPLRARKPKVAPIAAGDSA